MIDYPIAEKLHENAAIHCTTLAVTQNVITGSGWPRLAQPDAALRNGTLTFVKSGGRTYGITASMSDFLSEPCAGFICAASRH